MEEVTSDGGTIMMMDTIEMLNGGDNSAGNVRTPIGDTSSFMMSGSFKEGGRGSVTGGHRRATVRPSLDADELMNLLHESDPVKLELNRLENEIRDKDRELGEAQAEIKALKLSERLKEKAVEELTEELSKLEEKLKLTESLLESKNLEIKKINDEKKASMAAQFAAEATLRKIHAAQKDHDMPQIEAILALEAEFKLARPEIAKVQDDNKIEEFEDTKPPRELKQKRLQVKWNDEDAKTLAEQWVHASKDGVMVNGKADSAHWKTVLTTFNSRVTVKRTVSQLTGKWNKIAHDVKAFNEIYKGYSKTRLSGAKEEDVLKASRNKFKSQQGRFFIYEQCWDVLKHYPKFFLEEGVMGNKRSFQPDLEPVNLKVNLKDDDVPNTNTYTERLAANMQPVILDDPIQCPPGFAISKKSQKSSGSSDAATSSRSIKEEAFEAVKIIAESQTSAISKLTELGEKKLYWKALTFLAKGIPEGINKREKKFLNTARKNIVKTLSSDSVTMFGLGSCPGSQHQEDEKTDEDESEYSE